MGQATGSLRLLLYAAAFLGTPGLMFLGYNLFAAQAAENIRLHHMAADYMEGVLGALILLGLVALLPLPAAHRRALALLWLVRIGVALGAMLAYEATLAGDFIAYYNAGIALNRPLAHLEFGDGVANIEAFVGLVARISDSYSFIKVVFSFVGLIAVYLFYRAISICLGQERIALLYLLGVFPSIVFFGSLFGKEPIVLLGIALYCCGVAAMIVQRRMRMALLVVLGLALAMSIRIWLGAIFLAPVVFTFVMASRTPALAKVAFLVVAIPAFLLSMQLFAARFELETTQDLVARTDLISQAWAHGGSAQTVGGFGSLSEMLAFIPLGAFTALFRPLPLEVMNPFGLLAGLENAVLLGLIVVGLMRRGLGWLGQPVLLWAAATLAIWATVYGFVSYQNLGGGFRYKVQVTPILLMLGLYLSYAHHLKDTVHDRLRRRPATGDAPAPAGS